MEEEPAVTNRRSGQNKVKTEGGARTGGYNERGRSKNGRVMKGGGANDFAKYTENSPDE